MCSHSTEGNKDKKRNEDCDQCEEALYVCESAGRPVLLRTDAL